MNYYIILRSRLPKLRSKEIGRYPDTESVAEAARKHGSGTYDVAAYWEGEQFGTAVLKVAQDGKITVFGRDFGLID